MKSAGIWLVIVGASVAVWQLVVTTTLQEPSLLGADVLVAVIDGLPVTLLMVLLSVDTVSDGTRLVDVRVALGVVEPSPIVDVVEAGAASMETPLAAQVVL